MCKLTMAVPVAIMIYGGVFERHPKLKFVTVEAGVGWFAFIADYMNKTWAKQRFWTKEHPGGEAQLLHEPQRLRRLHP